MCGNDKNNHGSDTDSSAQGWATKCYSVFTLENHAIHCTQEYVQCIACRMLLQNQLWTNGYRNERV